MLVNPPDYFTTPQPLSSMNILNRSQLLISADHVTNVLASCNSLLYALRILRNHGISDTSLHDVFRATIVAKLTYAAPAWSGACSAGDRAKLDAFVNRCRRLGYRSQNEPPLTETMDDADQCSMHPTPTIFCAFSTYI